MLGLVQTWLRSGHYAVINGLALIPRSEPSQLGRPVVIKSEEGYVYFLTDDTGTGWILKKFLPEQAPELGYAQAIQSLIPNLRGFESGFQRTMLRESNVSQRGFYNSKFRNWLAGTILMPQIVAPTWADVAQSIRTGAITLSSVERRLICACLSELITALESEGLAHRDLSARNILVDTQTWSVHLVDWDSLYHANLRMQAETTCGTDGYMAPFVKVDGQENVQLSWREKADRFALAILNCEFLAIRRGSLFAEEGGLLRQADIDERSGSSLFNIAQALADRTPAAVDLLNQAIGAQSFDQCPSPADWLKFTSDADEKLFVGDARLGPLL